MELRHLRYFLAVAEEMNFTRAAEKLLIAQPPLSRQIRDLEEELGAPLFLREHHSLQLTEAGQLFRQYAQQILALPEKSAEQIREMEGGMRGTLYLAMVEGHAPNLVSRWVAGFHRLHPSVEFELWNGNSDDVCLRVARSLADLGVITAPYNAEGFHGVSVHREPWVAMIPPGHPLAQLPGDTVPMRSLLPYELIIPSRESRRQEILDWFARAGGDGTPRIRFRIAHMLNAYELTEQGVGIAIYPASAAGFSGSRAVTIKRLVEPAHHAEYILIHSARHPLNAVAAAFLDYVRATLDAQDGAAGEGNDS